MNKNRSESLIISRMNSKDLNIVTDILNNSDEIFYRNTSNQITKDFLDTRISNSEQDCKNHFYSIYEKDSDQAIGFCHFQLNSQDNDCAELFISIRQIVSYRDLYIFQSIFLMLDVAFKELKLKYIWINILSKYKETLRNLKEMGFIEEDSRDRIRIDGKLLDLVRLTYSAKKHLSS